jgi:hypothetical protein
MKEQDLSCEGYDVQSDQLNTRQHHSQRQERDHHIVGESQPKPSQRTALASEMTGSVISTKAKAKQPKTSKETNLTKTNLTRAMWTNTTWRNRDDDMRK